MLAIWVKARIKPERRQRFLQAIEEDARGSEPVESGCLSFNVTQGCLSIVRHAGM